MVALLVTVGSLTTGTAKAATASTATPTINYAGVEHSPLVVGDTETLTVTAAKFTGDVQYRAFIQSGTKWTELTTGYTAAVSSKTPFVLPATSALKLGKYKVSVWVKTAGKTGVKSNVTGNFDSYYVAALNCVSRDNANRVYTDGNPSVVTSGLTTTINGINNISGIAGPYLYKLYAVNTATGVWSNGPAAYAATASMTFKEAGTYMVVAHVNTANSTTWKNYLAGKNKGSYEGWKTYQVKVSDTAVFDTTIKAATFGSTGNVIFTAAGTKALPTATQYQMYTGTSALTAKTALGTATTVFPAKVAGDKVTVKIYDKSNNEVASIDVALGQSGSMTTIPTPPVETGVVTATVKPATFGSAITATSTFAGATQYQVYNGTSKISAVATLGAATTLFPAKVVGDTVTINLLNAAGAVVSTSSVVLK
jgi:hypothetical protein